MNCFKFLLNKIRYLKNDKNNIEYSDKSRIILMGSPEYNNLGDHAIAFATKVFIEDNIKNVKFLEITENEIRYNFNKVKKAVNKNDILLLQGGGNMGDIYTDQVYIRKKIITNFKENKIIIMPQTIHFESSEKKLPDYYFEHKNLYIFTREEKSFEMLREIFIHDRVFIVPDIVMYLINKNEYKKREKNVNDIALCIRNDKESKDANFKKYSESIIRELKLNYKEISTVVGLPIIKSERKRALMNIFDEISKVKILITDRLHGMIIAAIVGTPCIILPTFNHKVTYSYNWIKDLNYIELLKNEEEIKENLQKFYKLKNIQDNHINLDYSNLIKAIKGEI